MTGVTGVVMAVACSEPPVGSITGRVAIEGEGTDGVSVALSNGAATTTAGGGTYRFDGVEEGRYTATISDYPADASFGPTSGVATVHTEGQVVTVDFAGFWIRTSAIGGLVTAEGDGFSGVTVTISGMGSAETMTDGNGRYEFSKLRAGTHTVEISRFDPADVIFSNISFTADVAVDESRDVSFEGTYVRTSAIMGQVSVEGPGLKGVTVTLQGRGENRTAETNDAGLYMFGELRAGDYSVGISGYDTDEYGFETTLKTVTVTYGETASIPFEGIALRTAGIKGTVAVEGRGPLQEVTVSLSGKGGDLSVITNGAGQFDFDRLHASDYSVGISGYDTYEYGFDVTSKKVTVALKETATVEFQGILLRTAVIEGTVTVDGDALPGVTVTVTGGPYNEENIATTNGAGMYEVDDLHAGDYSVTISGYDTKMYSFNPGLFMNLRVEGKVGG